MPRLPLSADARLVAAIPARNEAAEIGPCLRALAAQAGGRRLDATVICLNNCEDASAAMVRALAPELPFAVAALELALPPERAFAGMARRIAMERAAALAGPEGVLLTTDADARVPPDWLAVNLAELAAGAEAVAGRAEIDPEGARLIPAHLHAADARECAYAALLDEIATLLDPDPADPWPRHDEHNGASIAVRVSAYRRAGGMPAVPLGEDRAFFAALRRVDARIRHAPGIAVIVSARTVGRASGGMAETIRRRMERPDDWLDERLEPARQAARRVALRARLRAAWRNGTPAQAALAERLGLATETMQGLLSGASGRAWFGAAWEAIEARSLGLRRRERVAAAAVEQEIGRARALRDRLAQRAAALVANRRAAAPADRAA